MSRCGVGLGVGVGEGVDWRCGDGSLLHICAVCPTSWGGRLETCTPMTNPLITPD